MPTYKLINSYDAGGDITKEWFVSYHYLIPEELRKPNGKMYERFKVFNTINCLHTKKERTAQLKLVKTGITELLEAGFNPYEKYLYSDHSYSEKYNICKCIDEYLLFAKSYLKKNSYGPYEDRLLVFKNYLIDQNIDHKRIDQITKENIFDFVNYAKINRELSNKTYNLYLQAIHTFLQFFKENKSDYLKENVCSGIKRLPVQKKGNLPFNNRLFSLVLERMKEHTPYLYQFSRFIYYSCMRPDAELRLLKIGDIDLHRRLIQVPSENSKKNTTQYIPIDDEFLSILSELDLDRYNKHYYLFTKDGMPGPNPVYEGYFRKMFIPVKEACGISRGETLYSFKHTRCIHLVEDGEKLHNIIKLTRHKTLAELMDYLKDMGVILGDEVKLKSRSI
ncbi:tyrosine-type recombinase/integrase [Sphingobacterium yanglingense]|uniref:Site-specific recombinase XerD n=1 Tax=Sphingobacterium yanglingense TaxID=1437280 RepID=A0A4R6WHI9_9SPHI|nr:tyrosine-type recombinase/integrase [Sphingobacterium yanglingense]TDQ79604.1 site-specific recombinase XerD [Sphingobacterium yanglingense]